ncbi:hypothetical protein PHAVU_008G157900 [Phaseolus vulgaris]|uniref:Uncharacterized protein n=1 Tax=Phaseolus vulgaris TaxID=3885 RepID=V7B5X9_PHAVU|nr:hypothetical protein PHAVU_008G157900g [Phaseolus vulgaris]ESW12985.1 hypothetical protein PHAVU_008G157900g [Phaseolus vulgaris]
MFQNTKHTLSLMNPSLHHSLYDLTSASSLSSLHQHFAFVTVLSLYTPPNLPFPATSSSLTPLASSPYSMSTASSTSPRSPSIATPPSMTLSCVLSLSTSSTTVATVACALTRRLLWSSSMPLVTTFSWPRRRSFCLPDRGCRDISRNGMFQARSMGCSY